MTGGAGNDTYFVDDAGDQVTESANEGTDTVYATVNYSLTAGPEIEFLRGSGPSGLSLSGNELTNTLVGGGHRHGGRRLAADTVAPAPATTSSSSGGASATIPSMASTPTRPVARI